MKESLTPADVQLRVRLDRLRELIGPVDTYAQQVQAAHQLGLGHTTLWRLIKNPDRTPSGDTIAAIIGNLREHATFEDLFEVVEIGEVAA